VEYRNYTDFDEFVYDRDIKDILELEKPADQLLELCIADDFLRIDQTMKIPFFAEIRNYIGARERNNPESKWIVKKVDETGVRQSEMAMICFFVDFMTRTLSAPSVVTRIDGQMFKATRIIPKSEQLSGANYTDMPQLKEQLMLDLINRWIYCDEDRNPNNYLIKYNSRDSQIVIAIDFQNVDLMYEGIKIEGIADQFGWARLEKTRYLTPLKVENFLIYDMAFFNMRFDHFRKLDRPGLIGLCDSILRYNPDRSKEAARIADNLMRRIDYVHAYFSKNFPLNRPHNDEGKHSKMGKAFNTLYDKFK
jgi:hypothetical protein